MAVNLKFPSFPHLQLPYLHVWNQSLVEFSLKEILGSKRRNIYDEFNNFLRSRDSSVGTATVTLVYHPVLVQ
jgi:hypothetical protein